MNRFIKKWCNTSKYAPADRQEYIASMYEEYKEACRSGNREKKMEIKQKLTEEEVHMTTILCQASLLFL